jgi:hypothetical protein
MFQKIIRTAVLSIAIAAAGFGILATTAATSGTAAAQSASFEFHFGHGPSPRYRYIPRHAQSFCAPRHAVRKARHMGVRDAHIVRRAPRRVAVRGWKHGHPVKVVFANERGCPVIAYR